MLKECLARFIISFPVGYIMVHTLWFYRGLSSTINYTYISMASLRFFTHTRSKDYILCPPSCLTRIPSIWELHREI